MKKETGKVSKENVTPSIKINDNVIKNPKLIAYSFNTYFFRAFPPKPCTLFSPLPCVPHALPTSFALT
jgi:hypothetical protein